jgi:hypothetical protein
VLQGLMIRISGKPEGTDNKKKRYMAFQHRAINTEIFLIPEAKK